MEISDLQQSPALCISSKEANATVHEEFMGNISTKKSGFHGNNVMLKLTFKMIMIYRKRNYVFMDYEMFMLKAT